VKQEATTADVFKLILESPQAVFKALRSEAKYRSLLRRLAANPPFNKVTPAIRNCPFLLGYSAKKSENSSTVEIVPSLAYSLFKAADIYIIDNTFFANMFPVNRAPPETDLEDFYVRILRQIELIMMTL
jgi:hypothetical protein